MNIFASADERLVQQFGTQVAHQRLRKHRLAVIVPCFNEAETIGQTMAGLRRQERELNAVGVDLSIVVIDDGSSDDTWKFANELRADVVLRHGVNQGLGAAVRTGINFCRDEGFDILVKIDADLQHDPDDVPRIIQPILADQADIVYGRRLLTYRMPILRRIGNAIFSYIMRHLTGWPLKDSQPGIFAINRRYMTVTLISGDYNYAQQLLIDAYHNYMRFTHVSVTFKPRAAGRSFITLKYPFKVLPQIALAVASIKPMRIFVPIGLGMVIIGGAIFVRQIANWLLGGASKPVENVNLVLGLLLFGVQTLFFGILAELIVQTRRHQAGAMMIMGRGPKSAGASSDVPPAGPDPFHNSADPTDPM